MSKGIHRAYMAAGPEFLAERLGRVFTRIDKGNEEDRILHNDMLKDVLLIIQGKEQQFFRTLAQDMLTGVKRTKKSFLKRTAQRILNVGQ
jgi:hypothetical protein